MDSLSDYDLIIPEIPSPEELQQYIKESDENMKKVAILKARGISLLRKVIEQKSTIERIGWLHLWAKTIRVLESAILAFKNNSDFLLKIISRSSFEYLLHALALYDKDENMDICKSSEGKVVTLERSINYQIRTIILERLRAYTAWCLWSEKSYFEELIHPKTLEGVWNLEPAKSMLEDDKSREIHEKIHGLFCSIPDSTDEELREGKEELKNYYREKIKKIDNWLLDPQLKEWIKKIENNPIEIRNSFFSLLEKEKSSIPKRLNRIGLRFAYSKYQLCSMITHGSSMFEFLSISESNIGVNLSSKTDVKKYFDDICFSCNYIFIILAMINKVLFENITLEDEVGALFE